MVQVRHILCPVDFSEFSSRALSHAIVLARWYGSEVVALHVLVPSIPPLESFPPYLPSMVPQGVDRKALEARLFEFTAPAREADVPARIAIVEGTPVDQILKAAKSADLLVLGTHGLGGFERLVLGSVTEKLLRKAVCPVLTIPPGSGNQVAESPLFKTVVCAVDFSDPSLAAVAHAVSLARGAEAHLTLVHVIESLPDHDPPQQAHFNVPEYRRYLEADARSRLEALLPAETVKELGPECVVASGKAYRQILRVAEERKAGVIVTGVRGRGSMDLMLFGSTANHLVRLASCPVLTVRS